MKRFSIHNSFLLFALASSIGGFAQSSVLFGFDIVEIDNMVQMDFAIEGGASCNGVDLERSTDDFQTFEIVAVEPGICGGTDRAEYYTLRDEDPLAQTAVKYRLRLGSSGYSPLVPYTFVPITEAFLVYPNPAKNQTTLKFENPEGLAHTLSIFNAQGAPVLQLPASLSNSIQFSVTDFSGGVYFFKLTNERGSLVKQGRFLVAGR